MKSQGTGFLKRTVFNGEPGPYNHRVIVLNDEYLLLYIENSCRE
jgi:hypothetical protein